MSHPTTWRQALRTAQHGYPPRFPLVQFPNAPLAIGLAAIVVAAIADGDVHDDARAVYYPAMAIWAYEEAVHGVNWFRHALGIGFLVNLVVALAGDL